MENVVNNHLNRLVQEVKLLQGPLTQGEFARPLGISQQAISALYKGQRPGVNLLGAVRARYPHTRDLIDAFLLAVGTMMVVPTQEDGDACT